MKRLIFLTLPLLLAAQPAAADAGAQYAAVQSLGTLNGVALHCKYLAQVRRMKAAVVDNAPKERSFGLAFDEATNASFLSVIRTGEPCPGEAGLAERIDAAIETMARAFANP